MTTAAEIVAMQAALLDQFRIPDPQHRGMVHAVQRAAGDFVEYPVSIMGRLVDELMFGERGSADTRVRHVFASLNPALQAAPSCAPMAANGLAIARAYRVQENMTPAVLARADALPADARFGLSEDEITPPRACGFAYFCEPVPHLLHPKQTGPTPDPSIGLVTWTAVVDMDDDGEPRELAWLVIVWDDMYRNPPPADYGRGHQRRAMLDRADGDHCRFAPVTAFAVMPGHLLGGPVLPVRRLGEAQMRSPLHTVGALWQLLGETLPADGDHVEQEREETDKRTRRRARMAGMTEPSEVTTVVLRRVSRPVQNPGTGRPWDTRIWIEPYRAKRWVGSERRGDRRLVVRTIPGHWSVNNESLPERKRKIVSDLRR